MSSFGQGHLRLDIPCRLDRPRHGFSLTELLVAVSIMLVLASMTAAAVSMASGHQKRLRTRAVIAKIDAIVSSQYIAYAGRNVEAASGTARGEMLRSIARGDLPDGWHVVADLVNKSPTALTAHQQAYVAVWQSLTDEAKENVPSEHSAAECLFLAVMHGGLSDCLDCESLHIDVGDKDGDAMPEFLDAWGNPISFILEPKKLRLPPGSGKDFFSPELPFDPVVSATGDARGGLMRPLIVSAGPDGGYGLEANASPTPGSTEPNDNLSNFDEEAKR
jgi:prepilin-type N-terminal cleavage/methylation domain-containing protein